MSKKQRWVFILLVLFPFALAMTFRTVDNYRFHQKLRQHMGKGSKEDLQRNLIVKDECYEFFMSFSIESNIP